MTQINPRRVLPANRFIQTNPTKGNNDRDKSGLNAKWLDSEFNDRIWAGRRCFIIGGGPSLKDFNWNLLKGELSIGINKAIQKIDPCILFSMDERFWTWYFDRVLDEDTLQSIDNYKGYKVYMKTGSRYINRGEIYHTDIYRERDSISPSLKEGLGHGANSGYAALNLAIILGANPIYLLGFDMHGDAQGKQQWFHDGYPSVYEYDVYSCYRRHFENAAEAILKGGTKVINLNPASALKCFSFGEIDQVIPINRPIVVSFFTEEYNNHAYKLFRSIRKFGLEHEIHKVNKFKSWTIGTQYKAIFLQQMLERFPGRNLLWIDADGIIKQYPTLFDNFEGDLGVHFRNGSELLSGTIYLKNNSKVKSLINKWIFNNNTDQNKWDQRGLQEALSGWNGTVVNIPAEYTKIFDLMSGTAVIEHFQASREVRSIIGR